MLAELWEKKKREREKDMLQVQLLEQKASQHCFKRELKERKRKEARKGVGKERRRK